MLQWYNHSIDIMTISIHTNQYLHLYLLTHLLTATKKLLQYITNSDPQAAPKNHLGLYLLTLLPLYYHSTDLTTISIH